MEKRTNHATSIAYKLIQWAVCFPEFKGAAEWKDMGFEMLLAFYSPFWEEGMIYPDGSTYESHTGGYGSGLVRELDESIRLLEMSSCSIPQSLIRAREKMYEWLLYITTPLGYSSSISMVYHDFYGFDVEEVSREVFDVTKREDFLHIGSGGREGKKPDYASYPFTSRMPCYGGVYIMRSGWDREALYLCAKMGPMHYRHSSNQGHFMIDAYGAELVIGPGYAQEGSELDTYTGKYMSGDGMSYNTIAVDGVGQKQGNRQTYALEALGNTWITNHLFDFLEGDYDFSSRGIDVLHTRSILFIKPEYWLVIDRLTHTGSLPENHSLRMKYQLDKGVTAERDGNSVYARNKESGVSLHIHQFDKESTLTLVKGQKTPRIEGWLAVAGDAWPAPAAIYEKTSPVPTGFETLFYPLPKGETAAIHNTERDGPILKAVIELNSQSFTDLFAVSSSSSSHLSFEGRLAWLRLDSRGVISIAIIEGKRLSFREGSIDIEVDRPATLCMTREEGDAWRIYADLKNYPALKIRFNTSDIVLDPGLSVTMCLRR